VLVTAFEPFGGRSLNRSLQVLEHVARAAATAQGVPPSVRVVTRVLAVRFDRLESAIDRALACRPDAVIMLGESGPAAELRLERVAVNRIDARIPDNAGEQPRGERVVAGGPAAYFSSAPLRTAIGSVRRAGAPVALSDDAGSYACNAAYYLALHRLHRRRSGSVPVLFVHVPVRTRMVGLRPATRAVLSLVRTLARVKRQPRTAPARRTASENPRARKA
jgi:pyroglutamyl-peptidase